jgi:hypothetical protein
MSRPSSDDRITLGAVTGRQCVATSRRTGERCRAMAITGRDYCRVHGGKVPAGIASPSFKTGRYSKHLPARLVASYEATLNDPDRLALDDGLALLDARLEELLGRLTTGESPGRWAALGRAWDAFEAARDDGDDAAADRALAEVGRLIASADARADEATWAAVERVLLERRKLVDTERRRLLDGHDVLTAQQAMALIGAVQAAVVRHVPDPAARAAIAGEVARLTDRAPR